LNANWSQLRWPALSAAGHVSDNRDGMAAFSSRGPTNDGRFKPDLVAPGTNVLSVRSSQVGSNPLWGDLPAGNSWHGRYCWSGGTSMSTPLVAGAAAVLREYLVTQRGHVQNGVAPSGALLKAFLINSALPLGGQFPGEVPADTNFVAGFGRVNMAQAIHPDNLNQAHFSDDPALAVTTGQVRRFLVNSQDANLPIRITLTWSDAPGSPPNGFLQNHLSLQVKTPSGQILKGDPFALFPNAVNNVQRTTIVAPGPGQYEIQVWGWSIAAASPHAPAGGAPAQDFALVASNVVQLVAS
jgi:hypothetical protein